MGQCLQHQNQQQQQQQLQQQQQQQQHPLQQQEQQQQQRDTWKRTGRWTSDASSWTKLRFPTDSPGDGYEWKYDGCRVFNGDRWIKAHWKKVPTAATTAAAEGDTAAAEAAAATAATTAATAASTAATEAEATTTATDTKALEAAADQQ